MANQEKLGNEIEANELEQKYGDNAELVKVHEFNKDFEKQSKDLPADKEAVAPQKDQTPDIVSNSKSFSSTVEKAQDTKYQGRKEYFQTSAGDSMLIDTQEGKKAIADSEAYGEAAKRNLEMKSEAVNRQIEIDQNFAKQSAELDQQLASNKEQINTGQKAMEMGINQEIIAAVNEPEEGEETETVAPVTVETDAPVESVAGQDLPPNEAPLETVVLPSEGEGIGPEDGAEYV